jgi:glycosyltransferase involved in cell wall biosynthesis
LSNIIRGDTKYTSIARGIILVFSLTLCRVFGVGIVWTIHNKTGHGSEVEEYEIKIYEFLISYILDFAIVHSDQAKNEVVSEYGLQSSQDKIKVIHHGTYEGYYENHISSSEARSFLDLGDETFVFLFFGKILPYKNVGELVRIFKSIPGDNLRLVIAGNPGSVELQNKVRNDTCDDDRIQLYLDYIADNDIQKFMNAADVLVLPYADILTSGTAILGMSFQKPVLAPNKGCLIDTLPDAYNFKYNGSSEGLKSRLIEASNSQRVENMGKQNKQYASKWTWDMIADETLEVYNNAGR